MIKHIKRPLKLVLGTITLLAVQTNSLVYAQQDSISLRKQAAMAITGRFPTTRLVNIEYQNMSSVDYRISTRDKSLDETKLKEQNRVKVDVNAPLFRYKDWTFTGSFNYNYTHYSLDDMSGLRNEFPNVSQSDLEGHLFNTTLNSTHISTLFNKPLVYNIGITGEFSQDGFERITGMAIATMRVKQTQKYAMTVGLFGVVDPMMRFPILPIFGIDYQLSKSWTLSFIMPQYAYIRKSFSKNTRLSLGSNMRGTRYYVHPSNSNKSYLYNKAEINTGLVFEQYINNHFIITARAGMVNALQGTLTQKNKGYSKRLITTKQDAGMYFNIGFSYNLY